MKKAILSMDVEDWYHLDYLKSNYNNSKYSMLDGLELYERSLSKNNIPSSFFILGEIARPLKNIIRKLSFQNHDIGSHGWNHTRPLTMSLSNFEEDIIRSKIEIENVIGKEVEGYRAPCFSLDNKRLEILKRNGYKYDSSRIDFGNHPLYGKIVIDNYEKVSSNIFKSEDFYEFQVSTHNIFGRSFPVSGGGYMRIFPWLFMKKMIFNYLNENEIYVFYIHPFEFSRKRSPNLKSTSFYNKARFNIGRSSVASKFNKLIQLLNKNNFEFTTFSALRKELINKQLKN